MKKSLWSSPWLIRLVFLLCLAPLASLAWRWWTDDLGINRLEFVARYTGSWTLNFLLASLAITPLRRIPGLNPLIRFRRMLGLFAFSYGMLHALHYFALDAQWNWSVIREDLTIRRFFVAGMVALSLMAPLAATSFDKAIRWMGGKNWQRLHRLVYLSAVAAVIHYLWQGKVATDTPQMYAAILGVLLLFRIAFAISKRIRSRRRVVVVP